MRKPERGSVELALESVGRSADHCVFIEDMAHNIVAARGAGLEGIVHRSVEETAAELEDLFPGAGWIHQRLR